jgi:hypothetical protein
LDKWNTGKHHHDIAGTGGTYRCVAEKNRKNLAKWGVPDGARVERLANRLGKAQKKPRQATGLS